MPRRKLMISPINDGLFTSLGASKIPNDAFTFLNNVYQQQGIIRKGIGTQVFNTGVPDEAQHMHTRLRIYLDDTDGNGDLAATVVPGGISEIGQAFSIEGPDNNTTFTVFQDGATLTNGNATANYDFATNTVTITGNGENPNSAVYFYLAQPVMGIASYERSNINSEQYFAFDTRYSYQFTSPTDAWNRVGTGAASEWSGTDTNFFWTTNWRAVDSTDYTLFALNNNSADRIRYWDGTNWEFIDPAGIQVNASGDRLFTGRIITTFQNRLLVLNTKESTGNFPNRVRYSQNGNPITTGAGSQPLAWDENVVGRGGFLDATTREKIITIGFIKDRLIVYFERSTWELVYRGNQIEPFGWQKINSELGAESTFSSLSFDRFVLAVGAVGIHACSGQNVERIDEKISDYVFSIDNLNQGPERVNVARDFDADLIYWSVPPASSVLLFPSQLLVYNFVDQTWATADQSFTAMGQWQSRVSRTWSTLPYPSWSVWSDPWNTGVNQAEYRLTIGGNQQGFMSIINAEQPSNDFTRQVDNAIPDAGGNNILIESRAHNFTTQDYVKFNTMAGLINMNGVIFKVTNHLGYGPNEFTVQAQPGFEVTGNYLGGGTITMVAIPEIITKQYDLNANNGTNTTLVKIDYLVDRTPNGEMQTNYSTSFAPINLPASSDDISSTTGTIVGNAVLETRPYDPIIFPGEGIREKLWHTVNYNVQGSTFQVLIGLNDEQMRNKDFSETDFKLHAFCLHIDEGNARLS